MKAVRAFIAGMTHETNSFSPIPTSAENFAAETYRPGPATADPSPRSTLSATAISRACAPPLG